MIESHARSKKAAADAAVFEASEVQREMAVARKKMDRTKEYMAKVRVQDIVAFWFSRGRVSPLFNFFSIYKK